MRFLDYRTNTRYGNNHSCKVQAVILSLLFCLTALLQAENDPALKVDNTFLVTTGYSKLQEGELELALAAFENALETNTDDLVALLGQAMVFEEQKRHREAFTVYDAIIKEHPQNIHAWNGRGLTAFNLEDFDEALTSFQKVVADQPINGLFYESLAWTQMCRGKFEEAAKFAKKAMLMYGRKGEDSLYPLLIAYFSYQESGDKDNALLTLKYAHGNKKAVDQWPAPVIDYLSDKVNEAELISFVTNRAEETEAHTYLGMHKRFIGEETAADRHLKWVSENGDSDVFEYTLARVLAQKTSLASAAN